MENHDTQLELRLRTRQGRLLVFAALAIMAAAAVSCSSQSPTAAPPVVSPESAAQYIDTITRAVQRGDRTQIEAMTTAKNGDPQNFVEWALHEPELVAECLRSRQHRSSTPSYHVFSYECGGASGTFRVYQHNAADREYSDEGIRFE